MYARDFDEVDLLNGSSGDPPPPPWLPGSVFGQQVQGELPESFDEETDYLSSLEVIDDAELAARAELQGITVYPNLNSFYQELIGCDAVTDNGTNGSLLVTPRGAITYIYFIFRSKANSPNARDAFVRSYVNRPVPNMEEAMAFLGAATTDPDGNIPDEWALFEGSTPTSRFDGDGYPDQKVIANKRQIIDQYRQQLRTQRGFRG
jgi:hypothetical protein